MVVIRSIESADVEDARDIWNEVVLAGDAFPQTEPLGTDEAKEFFASQSRTAVAVLDGKVVGLYILHPNNIGRCAVVSNASYAVASGCRGEGVGCALVSDSVVQAGRLGFTGLQFNAVVEGNAAAHHLYKDLGFRHIGVIPEGFRNGASRLEDIHIYYHPTNSPECGPVMDVADVMALEREIEASGTPLYELMKKAGCAVADAALERLANPGEANVVVLCGSGNNGGDGWVTAGRLLGACVHVTLATPVGPDEVKAEPARQAVLDLIQRGEGSLDVLVAPSRQELQTVLSKADVIVDAMLGTGFSHDEVREPLASWIEEANRVHALPAAPYVISVDIPSGLNAQTGSAADPTVRADETVTMLACKPGLFEPGAVPYVGRIKLALLK